MSPSATRFSTSPAMTVDGRKSPWIHPGGAVNRAPDGFFALAPPFLAHSRFSVLLFVITAAVDEAELSGARGAGVAKEKRGFGGEVPCRPGAFTSYIRPSESLTCGPARSLGIPISEEEQYVAVIAAQKSRRHAPTCPGHCVIFVRRALTQFSNPVKSEPDKVTGHIRRLADHSDPIPR